MPRARLRARRARPRDGSTDSRRASPAAAPDRRSNAPRSRRTAAATPMPARRMRSRARRRVPTACSEWPPSRDVQLARAQHAHAFAVGQPHALAQRNDDRRRHRVSVQRAAATGSDEHAQRSDPTAIAVRRGGFAARACCAASVHRTRCETAWSIALSGTLAIAATPVHGLHRRSAAYDESDRAEWLPVVARFMQTALHICPSEKLSGQNVIRKEMRASASDRSRAIRTTARDFADSRCSTHARMLDRCLRAQACACALKPPAWESCGSCASDDCGDRHRRAAACARSLRPR